MSLLLEFSRGLESAAIDPRCLADQTLTAIEDPDEAFVRMNAKTLRHTMFANMLDWCGVSLPNGYGFEAMTTGFSPPILRSNATRVAPRSTIGIKIREEIE
jgi:hypothetical protein